MHPSVVLAQQSLTSLEEWTAQGGGAGLERALELGPGGTIQEVTLSGLRGRGGGGFPTGRKWSLIRAEGDVGDRYVVCNGAEGEPGTFKDRPILRRNPYQVVEGVAIAAFAVGAREAYIAVKERFEPELEALERALREMAGAGMVGDVPIHLVAGPDHYLFGEEKGLLHVIEGDLPLPKLFPPYIHGLFASASNFGWSARPTDLASLGPDEVDPDTPRSNPTLVNNVETLATVPHILARGPEWYRSMGTEGSPGTIVAAVVGDVVSPGYAEIELGTPLRRVIDEVGGGVAAGRQVKAVFSGVANAVITPAHLDAPVSYEGLRAAGSGMGSAGFIVYDDTADMVTVARMFSRFLHVESCGQCPPCKFGTGEVTAFLERIERGMGTERDVETIGARLKTVTDQNRCFLGEEEQIVISSILRAFPGDFAGALERGPLVDRAYPFPKIVDIADGRVTYDESQARKQPDWTYAPE
jgi:NADH-quinone oxidoreductase subunit F